MFSHPLTASWLSKAGGSSKPHTRFAHLHAPLKLQVGQQGDGLQRLAQPHFVCRRGGGTCAAGMHLARVAEQPGKNSVNTPQEITPCLFIRPPLPTLPARMQLVPLSHMDTSQRSPSSWYSRRLALRQSGREEDEEARSSASLGDAVQPRSSLKD